MNMTDRKIFRRINPFILRRVCYAILGLVLILFIVGLCTYWGELYPEYRIQIIALYATIGIFVGWKIIRKGEVKYRLGQIAIITNCVIENDTPIGNSKEAMKRVRQTFKYSSIFSLIKNIIRHRNFRKVAQFLIAMTANLLPYSGTCTIAYIIAHPNEEKLPAVCHAITSYYDNRKVLRKKIILALVREIIMLIVFYFAIFFLLLVFYALLESQISTIEEAAEYLDDFTGTVDTIMDMYFNKGNDYVWSMEDILFIVALYIAWFLKVFTVRAYQTIDIVRTYLHATEANPPSDKLYNRLMDEWSKKTSRKEVAKEEINKEERNWDT